jgi:hypothetical protein
MARHASRAPKPPKVKRTSNVAGDGEEPLYGFYMIASLLEPSRRHIPARKENSDRGELQFAINPR